MKRVLFLCPFPQNCAAGQRLKFEPHYKYLKDNDFEIDIDSFMSENLWKIIYKDGNYIKKIALTLLCILRRTFMLFKLGKYDVVYIFLYVMPVGPIIFERLACFMSRKIIYDIEDNLLEQRSQEKSFIKKFFSSSKRYEVLIENAEYIIASTPSLALQCKKISKVKPASCILPTLDSKKFFPRQKKIDSKLICIGWTGTFSSKKYLEMIIPYLEDLSKKIKFKLLIIGNFEFSHPFLNIEVLQWSEKEEISQLHQIDIGLYPLPNDPWITGKSGLKTLQYMAIGIPAIVSPVGVNSKIISNNKNGFIYHTNEDLYNILSKLIINYDLSTEIGLNARNYIINNYSVTSQSDKFLELFCSNI